MSTSEAERSRAKGNLSLTASVITGVLVGVVSAGVGGQEPPPECPNDACDTEHNVCVNVDIETQCKDASAGDDCTGSERCPNPE
jgi:hypothetical protein